MDNQPASAESNKREELSGWLKSSKEGMAAKLAELSDYDAEMLYIDLHEFAHKLLTTREKSKEESVKFAQEYQFDDPIQLAYQLDHLATLIDSRMSEERRKELTDRTNQRIKQ